MSKAPLKICTAPGCRTVSRSSRCDRHKKERRTPDTDRPSAAKRGYGKRWQKARLGYLAKHPLCVECQEQGRVTPATEVDHIVPHRGDEGLFWDSSNWQGLCKRHHSKKTARGE